MNSTTSTTTPPQNLSKPPQQQGQLVPSSSQQPPVQNSAGSVVSVKPEDGLRLPSNDTMMYCVKLALAEDKPIMMDYWVHSCKKLVFIGIKDDGSKEKILVRNAEEYTSPISKIFKNGGEHILITENSIYVVDVGIPLKKFSV